MKEFNEEQIAKWARLLDNARFKSSNVGRSSPIPTVWIRTSSRKDATMLRNEINSGKIKTRGSQSFIIIGPQCLRKLVKITEGKIKRNYQVVELASEWMDLLEENSSSRNKNDIQKNRERINILKDALIVMNSSVDSTVVNSIPNHDLGVLRAELAIYNKIPEGVRNDFQFEQMMFIMEKITILDPTCSEAKYLEEIKGADYGAK